MKNKIIKSNIVILFLTYTIPVVIYAEELAKSSFKDLVMAVVELINLALPVMVVIAVVVFFRGLIKTLLNPGNPAQLQNNRNYMIWGVIALFCLFSIWGIISFIQGQFGFKLLPARGLLLPEV